MSVGKKSDMYVVINRYLFETDSRVGYIAEMDQSAAVQKWGEAAKAGFQVLPDILLKKQVELGLTATDLLVLINVTMHWWYAKKRPFPRSTTIAQRMGVDARTVQRSLRKLTELKLMERVKETDDEGNERVVCDLGGLKSRLEQYAINDRDYLSRIDRVSPQNSAGLF